MPFSLRPARHEDLDEIVTLYFDTFKSPLALHLKPNTPSTREWFSKSLETGLEAENVHLHLVVEGKDEHAAEIIAFAKWVSIHEPAPSKAESTWPTDGDPEMFVDLIARVTTIWEKIVGMEPRFCRHPFSE